MYVWIYQLYSQQYWEDNTVQRNIVKMLNYLIDLVRLKVGFTEELLKAVSRLFLSSGVGILYLELKCKVSKLKKLEAGSWDIPVKVPGQRSYIVSPKNGLLSLVRPSLEDMDIVMHSSAL